MPGRIPPPNPHIPPGNPHFGDNPVADLSGGQTYSGGTNPINSFGSYLVSYQGAPAPGDAEEYTCLWTAGASEQYPLNKASYIGGIIQLGPVGGARG